jgi:hypothetical protein
MSQYSIIQQIILNLRNRLQLQSINVRRGLPFLVLVKRVAFQVILIELLWKYSDNSFNKVALEVCFTTTGGTA